jgi:hypothetical protein
LQRVDARRRLMVANIGGEAAFTLRAVTLGNSNGCVLKRGELVCMRMTRSKVAKNILKILAYKQV